MSALSKLSEINAAIAANEAKQRPLLALLADARTKGQDEVTVATAKLAEVRSGLAARAVAWVSGTLKREDAAKPLAETAAAERKLEEAKFLQELAGIGADGIGEQLQPLGAEATALAKQKMVLCRAAVSESADVKAKELRAKFMEAAQLCAELFAHAQILNAAEQIGHYQPVPERRAGGLFAFGGSQGFQNFECPAFPQLQAFADLDEGASALVAQFLSGRPTFPSKDSLIFDLNEETARLRQQFAAQGVELLS